MCELATCLKPRTTGALPLALLARSNLGKWAISGTFVGADCMYGEWCQLLVRIEPVFCSPLVVLTLVLRLLICLEDDCYRHSTVLPVLIRYEPDIMRAQMPVQRNNDICNHTTKTATMLMMVSLVEFFPVGK